MAIIDFESRKRELENKITVVEPLETTDIDDDTWFKNEEVDWSLKKIEFDYNYVYELHMELVGSNLQNDCLDAEQKLLLQKFAKVKESISRTVLVNDFTALWQLHYIIQQAFGWSNCHLHNFSLLDEEFKAVTEDKVKTWGDLCGILFRFPDGIREDLYWHTSDFDGSQPLKTWYRSKYNYENPYLGLGDYYLQNKDNVEEFYEEVPLLKPYKGVPVETLKGNLYQLRTGVRFDADINSLLGRLFVGEVFTLPKYKPNYKAWREEMLEIAEVDASEVKEMFSEIDNRIREANAIVDKYFDEDGEVKKGVSAKNRKLAEEKLFEAKYAADERALLTSAFDPDVVPVTDTVIYSYDYGDGWEVRVTCKNIYRAKFVEETRKLVFLDDEDKEVEAELYEAVKAVSSKYKPICIACDGVNVLDDIGGLGGYCDFFKMLHSKDKECVQAARNLAECYGWTGRLRMPKNIL